jgi:hypothetical protein
MNDGQWKPSQSGNWVGRPRGSRNVFSDQFFKDLIAVWNEHGLEAMRKTALEEPSRFVSIAGSLIPREVAMSIAPAGPKGLSTDDWRLVTLAVKAIREAMPDSATRPPGEVLELVINAIRSYRAEILPEPGSRQ